MVRKTTSTSQNRGRSIIYRIRPGTRRNEIFRKRTWIRFGMYQKLYVNGDGGSEIGDWQRRLIFCLLGEYGLKSNRQFISISPFFWTCTETSNRNAAGIKRGVPRPTVFSFGHTERFDSRGENNFMSQEFN